MHCFSFLLFFFFCFSPALFAKDISQQDLSAEDKKHFLQTQEDILKKMPCKGNKKVTVYCRDKISYVHTNEFFHQIYTPYIRGIGGGYVGIGTDQNYTLIAWAKSELAWLMDYDPVAVAMHRIHKVLILASKDRQEYYSYWDKKKASQSLSLLRKELASHPDKVTVLSSFRVFRQGMNKYFAIVRQTQKMRRNGDNRHFSWLSEESSFQHIKRMFQKGRIRIMKGDLLGTQSLFGAGDSAKKLKMPIRIVYLSNAEEFWKYPPSFRRNVLNLPMDEKSVIVRTLHSKKFGKFLGYWLYLLQGGLDFQQKLKDKAFKIVHDVMKDRKKIFTGFFEINPPKGIQPPLSPWAYAKERRKNRGKRGK